MVVPCVGDFDPVQLLLRSSAAAVHASSCLVVLPCHSSPEALLSAAVSIPGCVCFLGQGEFRASARLAWIAYPHIVQVEQIDRTQQEVSRRNP